MIRKQTFMALLLVSIILSTGCQRNYYSGGGKSSSNCGCPGKKGMVGY